MQKHFPEVKEADESLTKILADTSDEFLEQFEKANGEEKTRVLECLILSKSMLSSIAKILAMAQIEDDAAALTGKILASYSSKMLNVVTEAYKLDLEPSQADELTKSAERFVDNLEAVAKSKMGGLH